MSSPLEEINPFFPIFQYAFEILAMQFYILINFYSNKGTHISGYQVVTVQVF